VERCDAERGPDQCGGGDDEQVADVAVMQRDEVDEGGGSGEADDGGEECSG
jgi:hypothetical protein